MRKPTGTRGPGPGRRAMAGLAEPDLRPGPAPLQPAGARRRQRQPGPPRAGSFRPARHAHTAPGPARAGGHRGRLRGSGRGGGRRPTHAYTRPSASSAPSPPYRGTWVQQPRHIRAGPARLLRPPRLLPGRCLGPQVRPGRARVTWRADVVSGRGPRRFALGSPRQGPGWRSPGSGTLSAGVTLCAARSGWPLGASPRRVVALQSARLILGSFFEKSCQGQDVFHGLFPKHTHTHTRNS